jgi:hypothetical protein
MGWDGSRNVGYWRIYIAQLRSIELETTHLQSSLMLCLAELKTSRGPAKSKMSMPACNVNNTLMIGTESVADMVATEWLR